MDRDRRQEIAEANTVTHEQARKIVADAGGEDIVVTLAWKGARDPGVLSADERRACAALAWLYATAKMG